MEDSWRLKVMTANDMTLVTFYFGTDLWSSAAGIEPLDPLIVGVKGSYSVCFPICSVSSI